MPKKMRVDDPKDYYVQSPEPISLRELSEHPNFKGRKGCSEHNLQKRCRHEGWIKQRDEFLAKAEQKSTEVALQKIAKKQAIKLEDLNDEATKRTRALLAMNEQLLKDALREVEVTGPDGKRYTEKKLDISPKDLRTLQMNILDLQGALRLYANFDPDRPVEALADNSNDDSFLDALFEDVLGPREKKQDGTPDNTPVT